MAEKNNKIIQFPNQESIRDNKKKVDWMLIVTITSVLVACLTIVFDIIIDKKMKVSLNL